MKEVDPKAFEYNEFAVMLEGLKSQRTVWEQENKDMEQKVSEMAEEEKRQRVALDELNISVEKRTQELAILAKSVEDTEGKRRQTEEEHDALAKSVEVMRSEYQDLDKKLNETRAQNEVEEKKLDEREELMHINEETLKNAFNEVKSLKSVLEEREKKLRLKSKLNK